MRKDFASASSAWQRRLVVSGDSPDTSRPSVPALVRTCPPGQEREPQRIAPHPGSGGRRGKYLSSTGTGAFLSHNQFAPVISKARNRKFVKELTMVISGWRSFK